MRKKTVSKREEYQKLKETVAKQEQEVQSANMIVYEAGGSINNLPVNTPAFNKWLDVHREKNPFIGKHVTAATEYNVEQMDLGAITDKEGVENEEMLEKIKNDVPAFSLDEEELGEAPKVDQGQDKLFIDMLLVENSAKRLVNKSTDEIKEHAVSMMRSYHSDPNYNTGLDLEAVVEQSKVLAIANKTNDKKLLRNY
jgi:hypothetical protein